MVSKRPATTWLINEIEKELRNKNYYMILRDLGNVGDQGRDLVSDHALRNQLASHLAMNCNVFTLTRFPSQDPLTESTSDDITFNDCATGKALARSSTGQQTAAKDSESVDEMVVGVKGGRQLKLPSPPKTEYEGARELVAWVESQAARTDIALHSRLDVIRSAAVKMEQHHDAGSLDSKIKNILRESTAMDGSFRIIILYLIKRGEAELPEPAGEDRVNDAGRRRKITRKTSEVPTSGAAPEKNVISLENIENWEMMGVLANSRQLMNETELRCVCSRVRDPDLAQQRRVEMLFGLYLLHQAVFMPHIDALGTNGQASGKVKGLRYASYLMTDLFVFPVHVSWLFHKMRTPTHWTTRESLNFVHSNTNCRCRVPFRRRKSETKGKIETELVTVRSAAAGSFASLLQATYGNPSKMRSDGHVTSRNYQRSAASICKVLHNNYNNSNQLTATQTAGVSSCAHQRTLKDLPLAKVVARQADSILCSIDFLRKRLPAHIRRQSGLYWKFIS